MFKSQRRRLLGWLCLVHWQNRKVIISGRHLSIKKLICFAFFVTIGLCLCCAGMLYHVTDSSSSHSNRVLTRYPRSRNSAHAAAASKPSAKVYTVQDILNFPKDYHAKGVLSLPYGDIVEPFEAWFSAENKMSRIDYYGGMDRTYQRERMGKHGFACKVVPEFSEKTQKTFRGCLHRRGTKRFPVRAQSIVPTSHYFKYVGDAMLRGQHAAKWEHTFTIYNKVNTYVLYTTKKRNIKPLRYEMMGYDTLLSSYYDHYVLDYELFEPWKFNYTKFQIPTDLDCFDFTQRKFSHTVGELNPMLEFMPHTDNGATFTFSHQDSNPGTARMPESSTKRWDRKSTEGFEFPSEGLDSSVDEDFDEDDMGFSDDSDEHREPFDRESFHVSEHHYDSDRQPEEDRIPYFKNSDNKNDEYSTGHYDGKNTPYGSLKRYNGDSERRIHRHMNRKVQYKQGTKYHQVKKHMNRNNHKQDRNIIRAKNHIEYQRRLHENMKRKNDKPHKTSKKDFVAGEYMKKKLRPKNGRKKTSKVDRGRTIHSWTSLDKASRHNYHTPRTDLYDIYKKRDGRKTERYYKKERRKFSRNFKSSEKSSEGSLDEMMRRHYEDIVNILFESFKVKHNKDYPSPQEHENRKNIYRHNMRFIMSRNRMHLGYKLRPNHLMDLTDNEVEKQKGLLKDDKEDSFNGGLPFQPTTGHVPDSLDWREKGAVTSVHSQGICGSCYAYAVTGALEGAYFLKHGKLPDFSEQEIIDCSWGFGNRGCKGGYPYRAMQWILKHGGLATNEGYGKYLAQEGYCHFKNVSVGVRVGSYMNINEDNTTELKQALAQYGPVSVLINTQPKSFKFYSSGVYHDPECGSTHDHAALVVGYGEENGVPYWLIKNSWSKAWGDGGYIKISQRGNSCGVTSKALVVNIK